MKNFTISLLLVLLIMTGCSYRFSIQVVPETAVVLVDNEPLPESGILLSKTKSIALEATAPGYIPYKSTETSAGWTQTTSITITLDHITHPVQLSLLEGSGTISIDGEDRGSLPFSGVLAEGMHSVIISGPGKPDYPFPLSVHAPVTRTIRHPGILSGTIQGFEPLGVFDCGGSPKQVNFSPDGRYIYIALLSDRGVQVFDTQTMEIIQFLQPEKYAREVGFVEGLFIPEHNSYFVSQMTTGMMFEYDVTDPAQPVFRRVVDTQGIWPKVLAWSPHLQVIAASNWEGNDVTLIDYVTGKLVKRLRGNGMLQPRGLAFSPDGKWLYVTGFLSGEIYKYATEDWSLAAKIRVSGSAMRHAVLTRDGKTLYVSEMHWAKVYEIDTESFTVSHIWPLYEKTNTIALSRDEKYLYASDRGPNNEESYLLKSPEPGRIYLIDTATRDFLYTIQGGTQPTGLDVSPDGNMLASTNFQDYTLELYRIYR